MAYIQSVYPIVRKKNLAKNVYDFTISCPPIAAEAVPGQFVHVKAAGFQLRRPISICGIDKEKGTIRIVFEIRGEGTEKIAKLNEGELIDILGPLGHGYTILPEGKKVVVIGGGIGVPPLLQTAAQYSENATAIIGFRNAAAVILKEDFEKNGNRVILCTDDGTAGRHGFVTAALEELLEKETPDLICACGPLPELRKRKELSAKFRLKNGWPAASEPVLDALVRPAKRTEPKAIPMSAKTVPYSTVRR